jgi:hypothetical protein
MASQALLFVIVGKNEPLYEAEFNKVPGSATIDSITRQNYFVLHSALDLVDKAAWATTNMYLKVVDKVRTLLRCTLYTPPPLHCFQKEKESIILRSAVIENLLDLG